VKGVHSVCKECMTESVLTRKIRRDNKNLITCKEWIDICKEFVTEFSYSKPREEWHDFNHEGQKQLEKSHKKWKVIHRQVDCGRGFVARCAQTKIFTKCWRECSGERQKAEEVKFRRESSGNYSKREFPGAFTKISGWDSLQRERNKLRPSYLG